MKALKIMGFVLAITLAVSAGVTCGDDDDDTSYDDDSYDDDDDDDDDDNDDSDDDDDDDADDDDDDDNDSGGQTVDVTIQGFNMNPDPVTVSVDDTVRWTNQDAFAHTVTSGNPGDPDAGDLFDSPNLGNGDTFQFTFDAAGSYNYFCRKHSGTMNGFQVIVNP
jgi:plastocyanin